MTKSILYFSLICTLILACTRYPAGVEETLSQAGRNRGELKKVLNHYLEHPEDSLKYQAACFLIDNMKWHLSTEQAVFPDSSLFEWHTRFDSLYTNMMLGIPDSSLHTDRNRERYWQHSYVARQVASVFPPDTPTIVKGTFPDPRCISSAFLISHIENAFRAWHTSPYASYLTFEQFKEMILPYRAVTGYPFYENGQRLNDMFRKHLDQSDEKTYAKIINRYNLYKNGIHQMFPYYRQIQHVGTYDMFPVQIYKERLYFTQAFNNETYQISKDTLLFAYEWNFGKYTYNLSKMKLPDLTTPEEQIKFYNEVMYSPKIPYTFNLNSQNDQYYYCSLFMKNKMLHVFYNKATKETTVFSTTKEKIGIYPFCMDNEKIIGMTDEDLMPIASLIDAKSACITNPKALTDRTENSNPVLVKYYFK